MERIIEYVFLLSLICIGIANATSKPVSVKDKSVGQLVTSSLLSWENFNPNDEKQQFEYAVAGGEFTGADKYKAYICRSTINTVPISGFTFKHPKDVYVCIVTQHSQIKMKQEFELLMNKGNGAKLKWVEWQKLNSYTQIDAMVSTINGGSRSEIYYIARHKLNHSTEHQHSFDHAIGWFDPEDGLGKIHATVTTSEKIFDNGELLVAVEAERYELHDIKFKSLKLKEEKTRKLLGQTILKNEGDEEMDVNAVIGYEYDVERNLGSHDGIARSVNTTVFLTKKNVFSFFWGIQKNDHTVNSKSVGTRLQPGTAINVTLWGNYTKKEGPYDAQLIIHWADGSSSKKRRITVQSGYEADLEDPLEIEYSETYWLQNNTIVPTTTQRTTTTSSTTNRSIFSTSISSNAIERITEKSSTGPKSDYTENDESSENEVKEDASTSGSSKLQLMNFIYSLVFIAMSLIMF